MTDDVVLHAPYKPTSTANYGAFENKYQNAEEQYARYQVLDKKYKWLNASYDDPNRQQLMQEKSELPYDQQQQWWNDANEYNYLSQVFNATRVAEIQQWDKDQKKKMHDWEERKRKHEESIFKPIVDAANVVKNDVIDPAVDQLKRTIDDAKTALDITGDAISHPWKIGNWLDQAAIDIATDPLGTIKRLKKDMGRAISNFPPFMPGFGQLNAIYQTIDIADDVSSVSQEIINNIGNFKEELDKYGRIFQRTVERMASDIYDNGGSGDPFTRTIGGIGITLADQKKLNEFLGDFNKGVNQAIKGRDPDKKKWVSDESNDFAMDPDELEDLESGGGFNIADRVQTLKALKAMIALRDTSMDTLKGKNVLESIINNAIRMEGGDPDNNTDINLDDDKVDADAKTALDNEAPDIDLDDDEEEQISLDSPDIDLDDDMDIDATTPDTGDDEMTAIQEDIEL